MTKQSQAQKISCIEDSSAPLAFKVQERHTENAEPEKILLRTKVRSLAGMQKEASVTQLEPAGSTWRMVSDEGPYLNGTDLAPFPLAFYTSGMQFNYMSEILSYAKRHNIELKSLQIFQENYYSMNGSFLKGDAQGGAQPVDLHVKIESDASVDTISKLIKKSEVSCPAHAAMRTALVDTFSLTLNGRKVSLTTVPASQAKGIDDPIDEVGSLQPEPNAEFVPDAITKLQTAEKLENVEGGVASSLKPVQNRQLHVHGEARLTADGHLKSTSVWLYKPIGSTFGFVSDDNPSTGGKDLAPSGPAFLSAGIGFCYMTQISRYANIAKLKLNSVRIVQDTAFTQRGSRADWSLAATALPVDTHVFIEADESEETAEKVVGIGAQTCFLHAALSGSYQTKIQGELNGQPLLL